MASRALAGIATSADDYINVYNRIISQMRQPVLIHWLGEMFDPALEGYWGYKDHRSAMDVVLEIINSNAEMVGWRKVQTRLMNHLCLVREFYSCWKSISLIATQRLSDQLFMAASAN